MSKHSEAFEAWLTVERYCDDTDCDNCCFSLPIKSNKILVFIAYHARLKERMPDIGKREQGRLFGK